MRRWGSPFDQGFKSPDHDLALLSFLSERGHDFIMAPLVLFVASLGFFSCFGHTFLVVLVHSVNAVPEHENLADADGCGDGGIEVEFPTILENLGYGIEYHVHHLVLSPSAGAPSSFGCSVPDTFSTKARDSNVPYPHKSGTAPRFLYSPGLSRASACFLLVSGAGFLFPFTVFWFSSALLER